VGHTVLYWMLKYVLLGPMLRLVYRPKVIGRENLPRTGAAILASNHLAVADSLFLPLLTPRRIKFLAKREYFTQPGIKGWAKRVFFGGTGNVPVDRTGSSAAQAALATGVRILGEGELLGIYPEGTRSPDGRLYRGRVGVARLWLEAGVPLVPCGVIGTDAVQPPGQRIPRPYPVLVRFGPPLDASAYHGARRDGLLYRRVTDDIMAAIQTLSGQEYAGVYASAVKDL
jgi:1-acyl-sn-glycerol-3-phosphate acyltransferase